MNENLIEINSSEDLLNNFLNQNENPDVAITSEKEEDNTTIITEGLKTPDIDNLDIVSTAPDDLIVEEEVEQNITEDKSVETIKSESEYSFKALADYLSDEGVIEFEDSDELEDSPEVLINSVKSTIAKEIENYKNSIPEKAKNLIEYLEKGGDVEKYIETISKPFDINNANLDSESDQEKIVREYLKLQGFEQEDIDETVQSYSDSLILETQAKVASKQLKKYYDKQEAELLKQQEQALEAQKQEYENYVAKLNTTIDTSESIAGLPISNKDKADFKKYLLAVDKNGNSQYAKDLAEDPIKSSIELAYLKYKKFDFTEAIKKGETEATKKLKNIFKSKETTIGTGKSIQEAVSKDAFAAFRGFAPNKK